MRKQQNGSKNTKNKTKRKVWVDFDQTIIFMLAAAAVAVQSEAEPALLDG